jgi:GNAT superfamily N-acetyltransferase
MQISVREAADRDADAIAPLLAQLGYPSTPEQVRVRLGHLGRTGSDRAIVAEEDGAVVGVAVLHIAWTIHLERPVARLMALVVDEPVRGEGIGRALVEECCRRAEALRCGRLELTSKLASGEAHTFYERVGFEHTARRYSKPL